MKHDPVIHERSEREVRDRALLEFMLATSEDAITCMSVDGTLIAWSKGAEELFGYSAAEMLGQNADDVFPKFATPEIIAQEKKRIARAMAGEYVAPYESVRSRRDGSTVHLLLSTHPICDARGEVIAVARISRDITQRKAHEQDKALLAQIVQSSSDAIVSYSLDGKVTSWNPGAERIYGYSAEEMIGATFEERIGKFTTPENYAFEKSILEKAAAGERVPPFEAVRRRKDGAPITLMTSVSPVCDANGTIIGVARVVHDLTERKAHEQERALLAQIVSSSSDAIISYTLDGTITSWNPAAERIYGYSAGEMIGTSLQARIGEFVTAERAAEEIRITELVKAGAFVAPFEAVRKRKDGSAVNVLVSMSPICDTNGNVIGVSRIVRDISERKAHEQDKALLAEIVNSSSDAIVSYALDGTVTSWNPAAERISGYSAAEMIGTTAQQRLSMFVPQEYTAEERNIIGRVAAGEKIAPFETVRRRRDGSLFNILVSIGPICDASGNTVGVARVSRDITDQKVHESQRALLSSIVECSNDAIYTKTLDGVITSWNPAAEEMFGYKADEIVGRPVLVLFDEPFVAEEKQILAQIRAGDTIRHYETVRVTKGGRRIDVSVTASPIRTPEGQVIGVSNIVRDITERKRADEALMMQADLLRLSFDAIIVWRFDAAIEYWNSGAQALYGFSEGEALGRVTHDLLSTGFPKPWSEIRSELMANGGWQGELQHRTRDGKELVVSARLQLVRDSRGVARVIEINRDITERKQSAARLKSMQDDLMHVGRLNELAQVSAGIAHELNQPLAALLNYSNLAKRMLATRAPAAVEKASEAVAKASEQAMRAGEIIRRMRGFVEKRQSNRTPEDINAIVKDTMALGMMGSDSANVATRLELSPNLPPLIADRVQIQQVLVNLIHNAVDAMADCPKRELTVKTALINGDTIEVSVADTGPGIAKEHVERLFMPFFTTKRGGMGIGLVITRSIVEAHGGKITVEPGPEGGTIFRFTLPAEKAANRA